MEKIRIDKKGIDINVSVFSYFEDGNYFVDCPSLNICGYGLTKKEANESFKITFEEQMCHMIEHDTLSSVLQDLGWKLDSSKRSLSISPFSASIRKRGNLGHIIENCNFNKRAMTKKISVLA